MVVKVLAAARQSGAESRRTELLGWRPLRAEKWHTGRGERPSRRSWPATPVTFSGQFSASSDTPDFRFGSKVSLSATSILRQLSGVEQTKPGESGPLAADLPLSGVLLSWPVVSLIVSC